MSDLPAAGVEKKEVPLTVEQQLESLRKDVVELARGVNVQAALLQSIVHSSDAVCKTYLELTRTPAERGVVEAGKPSETPKA